METVASGIDAIHLESEIAEPGIIDLEGAARDRRRAGIGAGSIEIQRAGTGLGQPASAGNRARNRHRAAASPADDEIGCQAERIADSHPAGRVLIDLRQCGTVGGEGQAGTGERRGGAAEIELVEQETRIHVVGGGVAAAHAEVESVVRLPGHAGCGAAGQVIGPFGCIAPVAGRGTGPSEDAGRWAGSDGSRIGIYPGGIGGICDLDPIFSCVSECRGGEGRRVGAHRRRRRA